MFNWRANAFYHIILAVAIHAQASGLTPEESVRYELLDAKPLSEFSNVELGDYLELRAKLFAGDDDAPSAQSYVGFFAKRAIGTPYRLPARRFNLHESDCVCTVERALAMSLATDWRSYLLISERLRHRAGVVAYKNRNFSTLSDWVPNNAWLLDDITGSLVSEGTLAAEPYTHVVRPKIFKEFPAAPGSKYTRIVFQGSDFDPSNQLICPDIYIPRSSVPDILSQLSTGDIVLVMQTSSDGHFGCNHMGIVQVEGGEVWILNSVPKVGLRRDELLGFLGYKHVRGFKFLRLRSDARTIIQEYLASSRVTAVIDARAMDRR